MYGISLLSAVSLSANNKKTPVEAVYCPTDALILFIVLGKICCRPGGPAPKSKIRPAQFVLLIMRLSKHYSVQRVNIL